jgi:hypothetical protein
LFVVIYQTKKKEIVMNIKSSLKITASVVFIIFTLSWLPARAAVIVANNWNLYQDPHRPYTAQGAIGFVTINLPNQYQHLPNVQAYLNPNNNVCNLVITKGCHQPNDFHFTVQIQGPQAACGANNATLHVRGC